eukprot:gene20288-22272_t
MSKKRILKSKHLTADNLREIKDAFIVSDTEHKGYLTTKEVCTVIKNIGYNPSDTDCQNIELEIDHTLDGKVGFDHFMDFLCSHDDPEQEEKYMLESFRAFDTDNKGVIYSQDIRYILMNVMEKCPDNDKKQILKVFHLDTDRLVTYEEFKKMIIPS